MAIPVAEAGSPLRWLGEDVTHGLCFHYKNLPKKAHQFICGMDLEHLPIVICY